VQQLLGHAAGCLAHVEFFRALRAQPPADPRRALIAMAEAEPVAPPGVEAIYSDLGYLQLGAVLERVAGAPLEEAFATHVGGPLGLGARFAGAAPVAQAVATELDDRGLVCGRVHDENAYYGGGICGHAGLFGTLGDVATFAAAILDTAAGRPRGRLRADVVNRFATESAAPDTSLRLGWDTPSTTPGVSHAGERWPRSGSIGHLGFTGTSIYLDLPRRRWVVLMSNRVHPTRADTTEPLKALRRAVHDAAVEMLDD
jgi:CubicO group peptidase (beta-lactamase class C family)